MNDAGKGNNRKPVRSVSFFSGYLRNCRMADDQFFYLDGINVTILK